MGIAADLAGARGSTSVPYIGFVAPAADAPSLSGETIRAGAVDLHARVMSSGQMHRALPITVSLCTAVAACIAGTVVAEMLTPTQGGAPIRIGMPSGVLTVDADVAQENGEWLARAGSFYRTARRLFEGRVWVPLG
jgi:2-methylaconitate cis-trans-isomerase PrpF